MYIFDNYSDAEMWLEELMETYPKPFIIKSLSDEWWVLCSDATEVTEVIQAMEIYEAITHDNTGLLNKNAEH